MKMKKRRIIFFAVVLAVVSAFVAALAVRFNLLPQKYYKAEDFGVETYISPKDKDGDGVDDQTDILTNARKYIGTKPIYKSEYYAGGYPDGKYGVCTDVVAIAMRESGYDLMELVNNHIKAHPELYPEVSVIDKNIDFRRVRNLKIYFDHTAQSLTTDLSEIEDWQGGDIVVFDGHIGIVSDRRNKKGIPWMIHNGGQPVLEEDALGRKEIVGHYRIK